MVPFNDPSSQSNYPAAKVTHTEFDINVDFSAKEITGTVTLSVTLGGGGGGGGGGGDPPATLVLDTNALTIEKCTVDGACGPSRTLRVCRYFQNPVKILSRFRPGTLTCCGGRGSTAASGMRCCALRLPIVTGTRRWQRGCGNNNNNGNSYWTTSIPL
jgi:hypothetical protein